MEGHALEAVDQDDGFLGVDLSEYFSGDNLAEADRVVSTHLKYSTRHSDQAWTASRLTTDRSSSARRHGRSARLICRAGLYVAPQDVTVTLQFTGAAIGHSPPV